MTHLSREHRSSTSPGDPVRSDDPDTRTAAAPRPTAACWSVDGVIVARGPYADIRAEHGGEEVVDLRGGVLLPGFVDTHVHYPQVRAIGGLGMPLLDWLRSLRPARGDPARRPAYAAAVADEFLHGLVAPARPRPWSSAPTSPPRWTPSSRRRERTGLRITAGQVLSDRVLPEPLLTTADAGLAEGATLIERWHGSGQLRYAVTPRFSLSASEPMLDVCAELLPADRRHLVHHPHQRERRRGRPGRQPTSPSAGALPRHLRTTTGWSATGACWPTTSIPTDHELEMMAETGCLGRPLPDQQRRPGQRAVPAPAARRVRRRRGPRLRRRRRHRIQSAQGGPTGLLRPAAPRTRRATR